MALYSDTLFVPAHREEHRFLTAPDAQLVTAIAGLASSADVAADIACQVAVETLEAQARPSARS